MYSFNYTKYGDGEVLEFFTSLEEYDKVYKDADFTPAFWELQILGESFFSDTLGIIINPATDKFFIPTNLCLHIILDCEEIDMIKDNDIFQRDVNYLKELRFKKGDYLKRYFKNKSKINYIDRLFEVLSNYPVFALVKSSVSLDEYFEDDLLPVGELVKQSEVPFSYYKKDGYIMIFTDKKQFLSEMDDGFYYYEVANMFNVIDTVFKLDYEGIIIKTDETEIMLTRERLLKNYYKIINSYRQVKISADYAFKIEG